MRIILPIIAAVLLALEFQTGGFTWGFLLSTLSVVGAVLIIFLAERIGKKIYFCPYCGRQVRLDEGRCVCGAPILRRRVVSLDSVPVVHESVIVRSSRAVEAAIVCSLALMMLGVLVYVGLR